MPKTVLFVDDDEVWCSRVSASLEKAGYTVKTANDATQAMTMADSLDLGLLILDLDLQGENGLTLMQFLKENHPGIPILLFTGLEYDDASIHSMLAMGANRYLPKTNVEELIVVVGTYLKPGH
jgi:DNA-binding response OmpR family regulator